MNVIVRLAEIDVEHVRRHTTRNSQKIGLYAGHLDIYFGPAALTGTQNLGGYALGMLDFFDIWILGLTTVGLAATAGISRARAAGLVFPLWFVVCLAKLGIKASPFGAGL